MLSIPDSAKLREAFQRPVKLFISYSHKDDKLCKDLTKHLRLLERDGVIEKWYDRQIPAGTEWAREIDARLDESQIILLLISVNFLNSNYCYEIEGKRALERHNRGEAIVIPVILRDCYWQMAYFEKLQARPEGGKPPKNLSDRDKAFANLAREIGALVKEMRSVLVEQRPPLSSGLDAASYAHEIEQQQLADVPASNPYLLCDRFVGREKELADLNDWLRQEEDGIFCISDLGGTGKTALASHWFHHKTTIAIMAERKIKSRYWCSFYSRGFDSHKFLRDFAESLGKSPLEDGDLAKVREFILLRMREEKCLLVLDGLEREMGAFASPENYQVDSEDQDIRNENKIVLPEEKNIRSQVFADFITELQDTGAKLLITTRLFPENLRIQGHSGVIDYGFRELSEEDARKVWELFAPRERSPFLREFFELVKFHPQVISVVAAAVRASNFTFRDWFENFSEEERRACCDINALLTERRHRWLELATRDISRNQRAAWLTICYIVTKPEATDIDAMMERLVVPESQEALPLGRFASEEQLLGILEDLRGRCLIGMDPDRQRVDVHPVIRGHVWKYIVSQYGHGEGKDRDLVRHIETNVNVREFLLRLTGEVDLDELVRRLDPVADQFGALPVTQHLVLGFLRRLYPDGVSGGRPWLHALPAVTLRKDQARILRRTAHELMVRGVWDEMQPVLERAKIAYYLCEDLESVHDCEQSHDWQGLYAGSLRQAEMNQLNELEWPEGRRSETAPFWLALLLSIRKSEHAAELLRALAVDRSRWTLQTAAECWLYLDDYEQAAKLAQQALERREKGEARGDTAQLLWEKVTLGLALLRLSRGEEALDHLDFANDRGTGWCYNLVPMFALAGLIEYESQRVATPGRSDIDRRQQRINAERLYRRFSTSTIHEQAQIPAVDSHLAMARIALDDGDRDEARRLAHLAIEAAQRQPFPFHYASGRERAACFLATAFGEPIPATPDPDLDALDHEERLQKWLRKWLESRKEEEK